MMAAKSAREVWSLLSNYSHERNSSQMKNGFLCHVFYNECNKNFVKTISKVKEISGVDIKKTILRSKLLSLHKFVDAKLKTLQRGNTWDNLMAEMEKIYILPLETPVASSVIEEIPSSVSVLKPKMSLPTVKILRQDCKGCIRSKAKLISFQAKMKVRIAKLEIEKGVLRKKADEGKEGLKVKLKEKAMKVKSMQKQLKRKTAVVKNLRMEKLRMKLEKGKLTKKLRQNLTSDSQAEEIKKLKMKLRNKERQIVEKNKKLDRLADENRKFKGELREFQDANDILISQLEEKDKDDVEMSRKVYDTKMRKATYRALLAQCPVAQVGELIRTVASELSQKKIDNVPSKSTTAKMAHELSVLSSLQTVECLLETNVATISWDATTELGHHINEIHISFEDRSAHTISIERLAGGKADDYSNHVIRVIDEMCRTYADYKGMMFVVVRGQVLMKILSALTDRAVVNHAACRLINMHLGLELIELNCNLHVLDGFANQVRSSLKVLDSQAGLESGNYCIVSKVIYMISKLRYKNSGDPSGFKAFLRINQIPSGMFVRYVGNRLHVMFHMGGVVVFYLKELVKYLEEGCRAEFARKMLLESLRKEYVVRQLQAIGLIGKLITGPWMKLVYKNEQNFSNIEMNGYFRTALSVIEAWTLNPVGMMETNKDVFLQPVVDDPVLEFLRSPVTIDVQNVLRAILPSITAVIKKQLSRYVSGDLSNPTSNLLAKTASAAPHNIWAERVIGMTCQLWKRCPMARAGFLESKIKAKTNRTIEWLDKKSDCEQDKLVSFARKRAGSLRKVKKENEREIDLEIEGRLKDVAQARNTKSRKQVEKEVKKALDDKNMNAGVFQSVEEVQLERLQQIVKKEIVSGELFEHTWYDEELRKDLTWNGRVIKMNADNTLMVSYWKQDEDEEDAEDTDVKIVEIVTDIVLGDVKFM